jgi:hypothetical protein
MCIAPGGTLLADLLSRRDCMEKSVSVDVYFTLATMIAQR